MLRRRVLILGLFVVIASTLLYLSLYLSLKSYVDVVDLQYASKAAEDVGEKLKFKIDVIDSFCSDWAEWDDTYNFILNRNWNYVESNLVNESFSTLGVNYIIYLDREGEIVLAKGYDFLRNEELPVPAEFKKLAAKSDDDVKKGLLTLDRIYVFSSRPILFSNMSGSYGGTLIFARAFDESFLQELSALAGRNLSFSIEGEPEFNGSRIFVSYPLRDYFGEVIGWLRVESVRVAKGVLEKAYLPLFAASIVVGCSAVSTYVILVRRIAGRIERLAEQVSKGGKVKVEVEGNDEITILEMKINELLEEISNRITQLNKLNEELRLINRIMRHDIKNDLTAIILSAEELREGYSEKLVEIIEKSAKRISEIVRRVGELEKPISRLEEIDLERIIREIAEKYGVDVEMSGDFRVVADENVRSIFENLISNAKEHGKARKIFLRAERDEKVCRIEFGDDGVGIDESVAPRIFEEGVSTKGSGFGLYIVRRLMEKYGGKVSLLSSKPAVFLLEFPLR